MDSDSKKSPKRRLVPLYLAHVFFLLAGLVLLVLSYLIYHPAALAIGAALVPALVSDYRQFLKLLLPRLPHTPPPDNAVPPPTPPPALP